MIKKIVLIVFPYLVLAQNHEETCKKLFKLNAFLQENHYRPKPLDDTLSVNVFNNFLKNLDEDNRLFTKKEINELSLHKYQIDNYIREKNCQFIEQWYSIYEKTIERYQTIIAEIKTENFPLTRMDTIVFSKKSFPYAESREELKKIYTKRILFSILREISESSKNKDSLRQNFESIAPKIKVKILDRYECKVAALRYTQAEFIGLFFSSFCNYFDPHTDFFSQSERSSFLSAVSADNLTFGVYLSFDEKDEMNVDNIIPGSSAYFTEKIDVGDKLLRISTENETYEIACSSIKKIEEIISSNQYPRAFFTFRKKDGSIYNVELEKKVMHDYENNIFSYRIQKGNHFFGYLKIPSFYSTFENGKTNLTTDVIKKINQLKEWGIDGLIIDIQDNGGGSMDEAVKLSGLFIPSGPIAIMDNANGAKEVIQDMIEGTIYDDPLIILTNGFSASASELFANTMQDYKRAILIGNRTLGKASMQRIFPFFKSENEFVKLTLEKFYRITGKSNQYIGTQPDVEIPSAFDTQIPREDSMPFAQKNDSITYKVKYKTYRSKKRDKLISLSKERIKNNPDALNFRELNKKIDALFEDQLPSIPLNFDMVFDNVNTINDFWKKIQLAVEKDYPITVVNDPVIEEHQKADLFLRKNNEDKIKSIRRNLAIFEATNILEDFYKN